MHVEGRGGLARWLCAWVAGRRQGLERAFAFGVELGALFLEQLVAGKGLAQAEAVFGAVVAGARLDQGGCAGFHALVAVLGQRARIALQDRLHDGGAGQAGEVGEDLVAAMKSGGVLSDQLNGVMLKPALM